MFDAFWDEFSYRFVLRGSARDNSQTLCSRGCKWQRGEDVLRRSRVFNWPTHSSLLEKPGIPRQARSHALIFSPCLRTCGSDAKPLLSSATLKSPLVKKSLTVLPSPSAPSSTATGHLARMLHQKTEASRSEMNVPKTLDSDCCLRFQHSLSHFVTSSSDVQTHHAELVQCVRDSACSCFGLEQRRTQEVQVDL